MLYLVSGASRSGKTMIAKKILRQKQIPYMSLDWLVMGFTNGLPQYGIHDKLMPDEIAEKMWSFVKPIFESMIWQGIDYVVEGEAILPELIHELLEKHPGDVKICFVGFTDIDVEQKLMDIRNHSVEERDWLTKEDDAYICSHIKNMVGHSRTIKDGCEQFNLRYFDTSVDFPGSINEATEFLLRESIPNDSE
jgi:hypothetical protein